MDVVFCCREAAGFLAIPSVRKAINGGFAGRERRSKRRSACVLFSEVTRASDAHASSLLV